MKLTPKDVAELAAAEIKRRLEDGDGDDFEGIRALSAKEAAERLDLFRQIANWDRWDDERLNRRRENITVGVTFAAVVGFAAYCFQLDVNAGIGALLFPAVTYWTGKTFAEDTAARWLSRMQEAMRTEVGKERRIEMTMADGTDIERGTKYDDLLMELEVVRDGVYKLRDIVLGGGNVSEDDILQVAKAITTVGINERLHAIAKGDTP